MENAIELYGSKTAIVEPKLDDYVLKGVMGGEDVVLRRDIDFAVIPRTKAPSITKAGAETICRAYGVFQRFSIIHKEISTDPKSPSFTFIVKCELVKINPQDGKEWVVAEGLGAASTNERSTGSSGAYDSLNRIVKMAEKRAKVDAAINLAGASSWFTQDMENENFMKSAEDFTDTKPEDAPMSKGQRTRLFAIAAEVGLSTEQAKNVIKSLGFASTKDITQKDYDKVIEAIEKKGKGE